MSKYSIAKDSLAALKNTDCGHNDYDEVLEALLVSGIQELIGFRGAVYVKSFLQYELESVKADGMFEIQKR